MTFLSLVTQIGGLALLWLACWGAAFGMIRRGVTYIGHPARTSALFLTLMSKITAAPLVTLLLAIALTLTSYAVVPGLLRRPEALIARHPEEFYLRMDYRYLVPKSFEVLFQQLVILALTLLLAETGLSVMAVVFAFLGIFGVLHLPILLVIGRGPGISYGIASMTLAAAFPVLILRVHSGFLYSYAAHWFVYTIVAVVAWVAWTRRAEAAEPPRP